MRCLMTKKKTVSHLLAAKSRAAEIKTGIRTNK